MDLFDLYVKIGADTSEYNKAAGDVQKSGSRLASLFSRLSGVSETNANKIKVLGSQYSAAKADVDKLTEAFNKSVKQNGAASKETQELAQKLKEAESSASSFKAELDKASGSAGTYAQKFKSVGSAVVSGLKVAATAGAGLVAALGKIGFDYNTQMETYTTNFEVMLGSAEAAAQKVEDLKTMAAKTPFEMGDLASATQTLLAFNVASEDSNGVLQQLGDISLGNSQKLDSLTRAYGKMNAAQKVTLEDINMMIDAGYNPLLNIQQRTGESMEDLYARISDGEVAFSEIQQAIADATSEGGQFYQGMEKASQTTEGLISTLQDVVKSKAGEFFAGVSEKIKEALPNVIAFIESIDVTEVTETIKRLYDRFVELSPVIAAVVAAVYAFQAAMAISALIQGVTTAISALRAANEGATLAQIALNLAMSMNPFVLIATLIAAVVAALVTLWVTNEDFRNAVIVIWNNVTEIITSAIDTVVKGFWTFVDYIKSLPDKIQETFDTIVSKALDLGANIVSSIIDGISSAWDGLVSWFSGLWDGLFGGRSVDVNVNASSSGVDGSHASGLNYVPWDGYIAELHQGEMVLTKNQAQQYRSGGDFGAININVYASPDMDEERLADRVAYKLEFQRRRRANGLA